MCDHGAGDGCPCNRMSTFRVISRLQIARRARCGLQAALRKAGSVSAGQAAAMTHRRGSPTGGWTHSQVLLIQGSEQTMVLRAPAVGAADGQVGSLQDGWWRGKRTVLISLLKGGRRCSSDGSSGMWWIGSMARRRDASSRAGIPATSV